MAGLLLVAAGLARAQPATEWQDVPLDSTETLDPLPEDTLPPLETAAAPDYTPPDHNFFDLATWQAMQDAADLDPTTQEPDTVLPPPEGEDRAALVQFPGIGWQDFRSDPPDTRLAKSPNRVLEVVNNSLWLLNSNGSLRFGKTLSDFFFVDSAVQPFDPKVIFDRNAVNPRFFVVATRWTLNPDSARLYFAVSRSPDPQTLDLTDWCLYSSPTLYKVSPLLKTFGDQPNIGVGADTFVMTANYSVIGDLGGFRVALIHAYDKLGLTNNTASCPQAVAEVYRASTVPVDDTAFGLQPVQHYTSPSSFTGTSNPVYIVNTRSNSDNRYWVWRHRNRLQGSQTNRLQRLSVAGNFTYAIPPRAPQLGGAPNTVLDSGDQRILQAAGLGDSIWLAHGTGCNVGGGPAESCIRVVKLGVGQNAAGNPTAVVQEQKTVGGGAGVFYFYPGIAVNSAGRTVVPFLHSSATTYLSSAWMSKNAGATNYGGVQPISTGACTKALRVGQNNPNPIGDYVGAQTDPTDLSTFWLAAESATVYPPPPAAFTCTWLTQILHVN